MKATEIRRQAMEKLSETKRRQEDAEEDKGTRKKSRRSGTEVIDFLKSQSEKEFQLKEMEIEARRKQEEAESTRSENAQQRHESLVQMFPYQKS